MTDDTPMLTFLDGKHAGKSLPLQGSVVIGRQPGLKVRLTDSKVSREHAKIFEQAGDWYLVDLNSRNGTLLNDSPVTKRALHDGDEITIGETRMRFRSPSAPAPTAPAKPAEKGPVFKEVIDLRQKPVAAPAGAIRADEIQVKERALQFSKESKRRKANVLMDDLGQRPLVYQIGMFAVVVVLAIGFLYLGLALAGVIG